MISKRESEFFKLVAPQAMAAWPLAIAKGMLWDGYTSGTRRGSTECAKIIKHLPPEHPVYPLPTQNVMHGMMQEAKKLIAAGDAALGWSGVFSTECLIGLRASGSLLWTGGRWAMHPEVAELALNDMELTGAYIKKLSPNTQGWVRVGGDVWGLGSSTECANSYSYSAGHVAGLLMGARHRCTECGETWLELSYNERAKGILAGWTIPWESITRTGRTGKAIKLSPFFGVLFSGEMPVWSAMKMLGIRKAWMGKELAEVYWERIFSGEEPVMEVGWSLPWGRGAATFYRKGLKRWDIHKKGLDMGVNRLSEKLVEHMRKWKEGWRKHYYGEVG